MTRRPLLGLGAVVAVVVALIALTSVLGAGITPHPSGGIAPSGPPASDPAAAGPTPSHEPRPDPGHEVFGFVPYWEMDATIADHVARTDLTTLALFSVTSKRDGSLDTTQTGYKRISGPIGTRLIRGARDRGVDSQFVYSSFGTARNARLFGSVQLQDAVIAGLVSFAVETDVDGIDVDVEQIGDEFVAPYGAFVGRLRVALRAQRPGSTVSVATTAGLTGAAMARAASDAGADRIFLMGYDYHYAGSEVGASAPLDRRDGAFSDLPWSLDLYEAAGVPLEKTILGLPLYGMRWRVSAGWLGAPREGDGAIWVPADNPKFLADPPVPPEFDPIEVVEFYAVPPSGGPSASPDASGRSGWQAIYVDSPETLAPKLALANERGLAGAGFWAIGYERGLPGYQALIARFQAAKTP